MNKSTIDLYHGTSTLFLDSIADSGLGGKNPVSEWSLIELAKEVLDLCDSYLSDNDIFKNRRWSFENMVNQNTGKSNWQHGDTYLSPSKNTAISYAVHKRYGSEILTYTLEFIQLLLNTNPPGVINNLFRKHSTVFGLLEAVPSPLLILVKDIPIENILSETGEDASSNLERIEEVRNENDEMKDLLLQQVNFRLKESIPLEKLEFQLINIQDWNNGNPKYNLYEIVVQ